MAYQYYPNFYQQQAQMPQIPQAQAQQTSGFVSVRSEAEARSYPVAYGNSVTFKDETSPYIYTKTMGFSQLDRPIFDKYKLVKEDASEPVQTETKDARFGDIEAEIGRIWQAIDDLKKGDPEGV